ncbi:hypothetical protein BXO471_13205, partial [Xanthomonas oryzae pv. oryzae]
ALRAHGIASSNEGTWDGLSKALLPVYQRQARESWETTYRPRIDAAAYTAFKANAQRFGQAAMELLTQRTQVLGAWLSNPLFLVTLEDYDGTIIAARCAPWPASPPAATPPSAAAPRWR